MANNADSPRTARKIVRRPDDGHIGGVCAGLADYFNVDPAIVRVAAVVLAFTGPGIPAYILAWIFFPAADGSVLVDHPRFRKDDKHTQVIGIVLIALALSVLWGDWWSPARGWMVPLGLVGVGAWLLLRRDRDDDLPVPPTGTHPAGPGPSPWAWPSTPTSVAPAPPTPADAGATEGSATDTETETDATANPPEGEMTDTTTVADSTDAPDLTETSVFAPGSMGWGPTPPGDGPEGMTGATPPEPPRYVHAPRRRRFLGPLVFGALLLWGGIAWLAGIEVQDALAIGLCILGGGFVLGVFVGGSRSLVFPALLVAAALVFTSIVDIPWSGGIGDKRWEVQTASDLQRHYELGIGEGTLDLRDLDLSGDPDRTLRADVDLGIGHLLVLVPDDLNLEIDGEVGMGDADILGRSDDGVSVEVDRSVTGSADTGTVRLHLQLGIGHLEVAHAA